jgi:hypothetical protein
MRRRLGIRFIRVCLLLGNMNDEGCEWGFGQGVRKGYGCMGLYGHAQNVLLST